MPLCFVVGPIGSAGTPERRHADLILHAVIKEALQGSDFGFTVKRADEDADPGMIGDRVISDLINADLVVADLTDLNPNAFYELGIRHSTLKPTIHVARAGTKLPFDTISHRTIFIDVSDWHSIVNGRKALAAAVRATQAAGYRVTNPITQANASFKMRESDDPRDRVLGEIQERLGALETRRSENVLRLADSYIRRTSIPWDAEDDLVKAITVDDLDAAAMLFARWTRGTPDEGKEFVEAIKARQSRAAARIHMAATKSKDEIKSLDVAHRLINRIP
jgi:hypothetical protein